MALIRALIGEFVPAFFYWGSVFVTAPVWPFLWLGKLFFSTGQYFDWRLNGETYAIDDCNDDEEIDW